MSLLYVLVIIGAIRDTCHNARMGKHFVKFDIYLMMMLFRLT
jgi:hypothetical protein